MSLVIDKKIIRKENLYGKMLVPRALARIAIPSIIAMFILSIYNITDLLISVYFGTGTNYLVSGSLTADQIRTAVSIALPFNAFAFAFGGLIAVGAVTRLGLLLGKHDLSGIKKLLGMTTPSLIGVSFLLVLVLGMLIWPFLNFQLPTSVQDSDVIIKHAWWYGSILIWSFPLYLFSFYINSMLRTEGYPIFAGITMIISAFINVGSDFLLVAGFKWGIEGSALSTIISWFFLLVMTGSFLIYRRRELYLSQMFQFTWNWKLLWVILGLGSGSFFRNVGLSLGILLLNIMFYYLPNPSTIDPSYQNDNSWYISLYASIFQIFMVVMMTLFGFVQGVSGFVSYNLARSNFQRVKSAFKYLGLILLIYLVIIEILILALAPQILFIFSGSDAKANFNQFYYGEGEFAVRIVFSTIVLMGLQMLVIIFFQALNKRVMSLLASTMRTVLTFIPLIFVFIAIANLSGKANVIWFLWPAADILSTILIFPFFWSKFRHLEKIHVENLGTY